MPEPQAAPVKPVDAQKPEAAVLRRRGIGNTLPVGWKPLLPPNEALQQLYARRKELDEARSKLFAQLKEVIAKSSDRAQSQHAALYNQLIQSQTRNKMHQLMQ
ncbi:unnamed protein product [Gongylonema pulchrum]|uniref:WW domain-containing protein n=1 Tax=Gongylonema pulchrum TaxID=637853 RepID=A0A183E003_9BILA|nr:unnamed protein product [Gongylonema pulchrum]